MTDMNSVVLIGRVTRDLGERDFAYTQGGTARLSFSIAVNRSAKGADGQWVDEASFFDVTVWGKTAENIRQYVAKGKQVAVGGSLRQDRWKDPQGAGRSKVYVVADDVQLLGGGRGEGRPPAQTYGTQAAQQAHGQYQQDPAGFQPPQNYGGQTTTGQYQSAQPYGAQGQYQRPPAQDGAFKEDLPWDDDIPF